MRRSNLRPVGDVDLYVFANALLELN